MPSDSRQASKRAALSDLQLAACFLYSTKLGSTGCCNSTGHASNEPQGKARYQLGTVEQVREAVEEANQQVHGGSASVN
jgi:hypothetical protein